MPTSIPFRVCFCSGADDGFSATALEDTSSLGQGWRSRRYCNWPQEIIVVFAGIVRIRRLQLLSHEHMIATRIKFAVGSVRSADGGGGGGAVSYSAAEFRTLGHVSFTDNGSTNYQSRELKNVHIDAVGRFLKLRFEKNHINKLNLFNQVGLVALNVIGDGEAVGGKTAPDSFIMPAAHLDPLLGKARKDNRTLDVVASGRINLGDAAAPNEFSQTETLDAAILGLINKPSQVQPVDELEFTMALDPQTLERVKQLTALKDQAIAVEQYKTAAQLKRAIEIYKLGGGDLLRLSQQKAKAVATEDFEAAQQLKEQIDALRQTIEVEVQSLLKPQRLEADSLPRRLEDGMPPVLLPIEARRPGNVVKTANTVSHDEVAVGAKAAAHPEPSAQQDGGAAPAPPSPLPASSSQPPPSPPPPPSTEEPSSAPASPTRGRKFGFNKAASKGRFDETPVGKSQGLNPASATTSKTSPAATASSADLEVTPLTDSQRSAFAEAVDVFGEQCVAKLLSKAWQLKDQALVAVVRDIKAANNSSADIKASAIAQCLTAVAGIKVKKVASRVAEVLLAVINDFLPKISSSTLSSTSAEPLAKALTAELLVRCSESQAQIRTQARALVVSLCQHNHAFPPEESPARIFLAPVPVSTAWRQAQAVLEVAAALVETLGLADAGGAASKQSPLTTASVADLAAPLLAHSKSEVRTAAVAALAACYKFAGRRVENMLRLDPQKDAAVLKMVQEAFGKVVVVPAAEQQQNAKKRGKELRRK